MNVTFAQRAVAEIEVCDRWWKANRDLKRLFQEELAAVIFRISTDPNLGQVYRIAPVGQQRRMLMPKTGHHLYYRFEAPDQVYILSVWGARRKRGPKL